MYDFNFLLNLATSHVKSLKLEDKRSVFTLNAPST